MSVLITSPTSLKALTVIRSLGKLDIDIDTANPSRNSLGSLSKYSGKYFYLPSPKKSPDQFIESLKQLLAREKHDVLLPVHSEDTYLIAKHKKSLEKYTRIPFHDYEIISKVNDKGTIIREAEKVGVHVPKTYEIQDLNQLHVVAGVVDYPVVIKLQESSSSIGLSYAYNREDLYEKYNATVKKFGLNSTNYPIIQEFIEGDGYGVSLLFNHGDLRAKFTHKRIREFPISGGPSTARISVRHAAMEDAAVRLLQHFEWHGVAMVEFKLTRDDIPVLMEVNPRFWGSLNMAVQSGVDFPALLYTMAMEGDVKPVLSYKTGVTTKNFFIDTVAILQMVKKTKNIGLMKDIFSFPVNDDVISLDDPLPALGFIRTGIMEMVHGRYE
jgi:predicted ATP-grasp superfamily ATP-dependent carboligase